MKKLKKFAIVFTLMIVGLTMVSSLPTALAAWGTGDQVLDIGNTETSARSLLTTMLNYFLGFLGFLAVVMVIYGGITYTASAGDEEAVGNAKNIIKNALIGLVVIMLSVVLVNFVFDAGGGVEK